MMRRYWVSKIAQEHVDIVRDKGYTQINMGPKGPLEKLHVGDWILYYSPTFFYAEEEPICEKFTGISCVTDHRIYPQNNLFPDRWRRNVEFFHCLPRHPQEFIGKVNFLPHESTWKDILEQQILEISRQDFIYIAQKILIPQSTKILLL